MPPSREEESETQRKAHAKRARETRRSTQGVTFDEIKSAEQYVKNQQQQKEQQQKEQQQKAAAPTVSDTRKRRKRGVRAWCVVCARARGITAIGEDSDIAVYGVGIFARLIIQCMIWFPRLYK